MKPRPGVCRICGCCDELACANGCIWVDADLCSECVKVDALSPAARSALLDLSKADTSLWSAIYPLKPVRGELLNAKLSTRRWISSSTLRELESNSFLRPHGARSRTRVRRELTPKGRAIVERLSEIHVERSGRLRYARAFGL